MFENFIFFVKIVGYLKMIEIIYRLIMTVIVRPMRTPDHLVERYGKGTYALVTGASDGIGLGYCKHLAKLGFNLVMTSRDLARL